jgi:hypothetical protein
MPKNTCYICGITIGVGNVHGCCADCLSDKTTLYHRTVYEVELRKRAEKAEADVERLRDAFEYTIDTLQHHHTSRGGIPTLIKTALRMATDSGD